MVTASFGGSREALTATCQAPERDTDYIRDRGCFELAHTHRTAYQILNLLIRRLGHKLTRQKIMLLSSIQA